MTCKLRIRHMRLLLLYFVRLIFPDTCPYWPGRILIHVFLIPLIPPHPCWKKYLCGCLARCKCWGKSMCCLSNAKCRAKSYFALGKCRKTALISRDKLVHYDPVRDKQHEQPWHRAGRDVKARCLLMHFEARSTPSQSHVVAARPSPLICHFPTSAPSVYVSQHGPQYRFLHHTNTTAQRISAHEARHAANCSCIVCAAEQKTTDQTFQSVQ